MSLSMGVLFPDCSLCENTPVVRDNTHTRTVTVTGGVCLHTHILYFQLFTHSSLVGDKNRVCSSPFYPALACGAACWALLAARLHCRMTSEWELLTYWITCLISNHCLYFFLSGSSKTQAVVWSVFKQPQGHITLISLSLASGGSVRFPEMRNLLHSLLTDCHFVFPIF